MPDKSRKSPHTILERLRESKPARAIALLGAGATLATLTACGPSNNEVPAPAPTTASQDPTSPDTPAPNDSETSSVGNVPAPQPSGIETTVAVPEVDLMDINTYKLRHEPLMNPETAWTYMRTKLDELGSTPQIAPIAYEYTDMIQNSDATIGMEFDAFEYYKQLNDNLTIFANLISANREYLDNSHLLFSSLQDVMMGLSYAKDIEKDPLVELFIEAIEKVPEGTVIRNFAIVKVANNEGTLFNVHYVDADGIDQIDAFRHSDVPYLAKDINPDTVYGDYTYYLPSSDFNGPVELAFDNINI